MKKILAVLVLALASAVLAACGDEDGGTATTTETSSEATKGGPATGEAAKGASAGGDATTDSGAGAAKKDAGATTGGGGAAEGSTVTFEADPGGGLSYTTTEASAHAGNVTIEFDNPQPLEHDVDVEDSSGEEIGGTELISDDSTSVTLQGMKPGDYTFYCSVPGHREGGMEGTLTVK